MPSRHKQPLDVWIPGVDELGPVYYMAERQLFHRPFYRRPDMITLVVALGPMFILDAGHMELFLMAILTLPLVMLVITMLWSFMGARKLLVSGSLFHLTITPLPMSRVLKDYERHFRLTGMQSMTLLLTAWTIVLGLALWFGLVSEFEYSSVAGIYAYLFFARQVLCPAAASLGFRAALSGRIPLRAASNPRVLSIIMFSLLLLPFFLYRIGSALIQYNTFNAAGAAGGPGALNLILFLAPRELALYLYVVFCFAMATPVALWLKEKVRPEEAEEDFEQRVLKRIGSLSYS